MSPNGKQIWVVDTDVPAFASQGFVTVISAATMSRLATIPVASGALDVAFSPNGRFAYVSDNGVTEPGEVQEINTSTRVVVRTLTEPGWRPTSVAVSPNGKDLWVSESGAAAPSSSNDDVYAFSTSTGTLLARITVGRGAFFATLSTDGHFLYVADKESCDVREIATASFRVVSVVQVPRADRCPFGVAAGDRDETALAVTGTDHSAAVGPAGNDLLEIDFATGTVRASHPVGLDPVTVATRPGRHLAYIVDADRPAVYVVKQHGLTSAAVWTLLVATPAQETKGMSTPAPDDSRHVVDSHNGLHVRPRATGRCGSGTPARAFRRAVASEPLRPRVRHRAAHRLRHRIHLRLHRDRHPRVVRAGLRAGAPVAHHAALGLGRADHSEPLLDGGPPPVDVAREPFAPLLLRQLAGAALLVTAVAFLGLGLEHSPLSHLVPALTARSRSAPPGHIASGGGNFVVVRPGSPPGHPPPKALHHGRGGGPGPPSDLSSWLTVGHVLLEVLGLTIAGVAVDLVWRAWRKVRRRRQRDRLQVPA